MSTYPTTPAPATVDVLSIIPRNVTVTRSLRTVVANVGTQAFEFSLTYPPLSRANTDILRAFFARVGGTSSFSFADPRYLGPRGSVPDATTISCGSSGGAIGASSIGATNFAVSSTGVLKMGDYIKFTGHTKIYTVIDDITSDSSGNATITFSPTLQATVAGSTEIFHAPDDVEFTCIFSSDRISFGFDQTMLGVVVVGLREVM